jgi:hypothetical protein
MVKNWDEPVIFVMYKTKKMYHIRISKMNSSTKYGFFLYHGFHIDKICFLKDINN